MSLKTTCWTVLAVIAMAGLIPLAATQDQETNAPADLARLVRDKPAAEAADISGKLLTEAIRLDGAPRDVLRRVVITTTVLMTGVIQESDEVKIAVAGALLEAAGETYEMPVAAAIARVLQRTLPEWESLLAAALDTVPEDRRSRLERAAANPRRTLGLRLSWDVNRYADEVVAMTVDPDLMATQSELASTLPTTTTTTTSTTTTTTRPSPTPVGRR